MEEKKTYFETGGDGLVDGGAKVFDEVPGGGCCGGGTKEGCVMVCCMEVGGGDAFVAACGGFTRLAIDGEARLVGDVAWVTAGGS